MAPVVASRSPLPSSLVVEWWWSDTVEDPVHGFGGRPKVLRRRVDVGVRGQSDGLPTDVDVSRLRFLTWLAVSGAAGPLPRFGDDDRHEPAYRYRTCPNDRSPLSRSAAPISWPQPALASIMTIIWIYTPAS
jgi:hypothetical protein